MELVRTALDASPLASRSFDLGVFEATDWSFPASSVGRDLHPYPARFIPEIPRAAIATLRPQGVVLDPFCGSGATLHEALRAGLRAIGVDLNPVACMISRVKTTPWSAQDTVVASQHVADFAKALGEREPHDLNNLHREIPRLSHWFSEVGQELLSRSMRYIDDLEGPWRDRVAVAVSAATVRLSRQDSDTRYAAVEKDLNYESGRRVLIDSLRRVTGWLETNTKGVRKAGEVHCADSRDLGFLPDESVDAAIFSPPYPNAYEYWLYHKYRMYWQGFDPLTVRAREIGARPHYSKPNGRTAADFASEMTQVFSGLARVLRPNSGVFVVVGDSQIRGEPVDNRELLTQVADQTGHDLVAAALRPIRASSTSFNLAHRRARVGEHVLLFRRRP